MSDGTSMVMESSENGTDISQDDTGNMEEIPEDTILLRQTSVNLVPFIGQRFVSQDAAYEFYCSFAKQCGFSIRRHRTRGKDGVGRGVTRRDFTCHRGGYPQMKPSEDGKMQRNRKSSRCGCQAYMRIVKRADFDVPEWRVTGFSNIHNHELLNQLKCISFLPIAPYLQMTRVGFACLQKLECQNVNRDNDAIDLIAMCKKMKDEDHNFKYDFKIDGNNRLEHISWSYASSVQLYEAFGDAVVFDTTNRLDAYDMILGMWLGVDNHAMTCFFGCVLLRDENMESFSWALKAFVDFMNGKAPQTIMTDQNIWLKEAIAIEMPETKQAFCIWHIIAKFSDWFSMLLGSCYDDWKAEFLRLYNLEFVEDFEEGWKEMVAEIIDLSNCTGVRAETQRKTQKVYLKTGSPIESQAASVLTPYAFNKLQEELVLAPQYASFPIDEYCYQVRHHTQVSGGCKVVWDPCQEHISCSCNQFEFLGILCRHVLRVLSTNNCFHIPDQFLPTRWCDVSLSSNTRVHSERIQLLESMVSTFVTESIETEERLDVACEQIAMVLSHIKDLPRQTHCENAYNCPSESLILPNEGADGIVQTVAIGNPHDTISLGKKERRPRDGNDISRKRRHYSGPCCGQFGHDASDCPIMGSDHLNGDELGYI
ncbi:hypothetical protein GH714_028989 [Hevea brasiliensis]|uniref:Protein FAR1-RELATED SEQUENCE n=1 Tax=Hevea brasiliensis TaxID=3981 RepID=A0A6A6KLC1_HEVBR|nr:hypothetical protein GH714_028989 [Hevea brasiliensis]